MTKERFTAERIVDNQVKIRGVGLELGEIEEFLAGLIVVIEYSTGSIDQAKIKRILINYHAFMEAFAENLEKLIALIGGR